jgi:tetratricopeptide (TPR) repeat protein
MGDLTIGLLGALLATNQPVAVSNLVAEQTGLALPIRNEADPAERELHNLMISDDAAIDEVNDWINTNTIPRSDTNALAALNVKIRSRLDVMKQGYETFLRDHPDSARGFLAYGSFLTDIGDEDGGKVQYENSKQLDPKNPAVWNQLANYYGENGELTNAFADYTEAIRLDPTEPVYYQNFATTVYLYRKDVRDFYHINEQQVFDKALGLYQQAMKLAPDDLVIATDYAESYYGIKPMRTNDALVAWTNALNICKDETEREGVEVHLARTKIAAGFYDEAQDELDIVTNATFKDLKRRLIRSLAEHKNPPPDTTEAPGTNSVTEDTNNSPITLTAVMKKTFTAEPSDPPAVTNLSAADTNLLELPPPIREQKSP